MTDVSGYCQVLGTPKAPFVDVPLLRFLVAFVMAPIVVGVLGFWLLVPLYALAFGGPFWLVLGGPILWLAVRRGMTRSRDFALLGLVVNCATPVVVFVGLALFREPQAYSLAGFFFVFGAIMAPIWGAMFGFLYRE